MLISELFRKGYLITYDNPKSYPQIKEALRKVGYLKTTWNNTTVFVSPKVGVVIRDIQNVVRNELKTTGTAVVLGVGSKDCWQFSGSIGWRKVN